MHSLAGTEKPQGRRANGSRHMHQAGIISDKKGTAAETLETQRVRDVHEFPGHIVCDAASRSEIVVPLIVDGRLVGVLDIDSPSIGRFSPDDQTGIERLCESFCALQSGRARFI